MVDDVLIRCLLTVNVVTAEPRVASPDETTDTRSQVVTDYHLPGYISSSLLDVFHYYPRTKKDYNHDPNGMLSLFVFSFIY